MNIPLAEELVLSLELAGTLMTLEEFDAATECDELYNYELIHGVLVVTPPPLDAEVGPNEMLGHWLLGYQEHHPQGSALDGTLVERTVRATASRRRADRLIWAGLGRQPNTRVDPTTVIVEFVSRGKKDRQRDYVEKRDEYIETGVAQYWIIDRFRRTLTVILNEPSGPRELIFHENDVYCPSCLPGFELQLARLFAVADQWTEREEP